ncbi:pilus assembly PilX family protein [Undibacterium luofuense]|uniref:Tfp pilus assembly protein PilX n=1 Tax=Undibacterium luofuense TaxID=2828733 RepID=A0A941DJT9_9BURK|nr:hypothetical protein [Undibacterium luofuense]MBR7781145.1 hypothetical protein [Undibacterium luofuense]
MNILLKPIHHQSGISMFFALIILVIISISMVALVRMTDINAIIAGNLAFRESATSGGDRGIEVAIRWLRASDNGATGLDPWQSTAHPLNTDRAANGYYSSMDLQKNLTSMSWDNTNSVDAGKDAAANQIRYVIQRMCRSPNQVLSDSNCLFSDSAEDNDGHNVINATQAGAVKNGKSPVYRITVKVSGPRNTISYVQGFIY